MIVISFALFVGLVLWEHFGRIFFIDLRPTIGINILIDILNNFFTSIGFYIAYVSSYLHWLNFKELGITLVELFDSFFKLVVSPFFIMKGYITTAMEFIDGPYTIYFGTFLLISTILCICYKYNKKYLYIITWILIIIATYYAIIILIAIFLIICHFSPKF